MAIEWKFHHFHQNRNIYHYFHYDCISDIMKFSKKRLCPMCRTEFETSEEEVTEVVEIVEKAVIL